MLVYRGDLLLGIASMLVQVTLVMIVWDRVYGDADQVSGVSRDQIISYAILAACFQTIVMPWNFSSIPQRIRQGQIGVDLIRPHGLIATTLARNAGTMLARLPIGAAGVIWALLLGAVLPPPNVGYLLAWLCSTALAVTIALLLNLTVSMVAFWTPDCMPSNTNEPRQQVLLLLQSHSCRGLAELRLTSPIASDVII